MCEQLKNDIKYRMAESTKISRKKIYYVSSDDSDDVEKKTEDLRQASSRKRRRAGKMISEQSVITSNSNKKKKEEGCNSLVNDTGSRHEDLQEYSRTDLISTIEILRAENRRLREENAKLNAMRNAVHDDLPEMKELSSEILRNLRATSVLVGLYSSADKRCSCRNDNSSEKNDAPSTLLPTSVGSHRPNFAEQQCDIVENSTVSALSVPYKQLEATQLKKELPIFEEGSSFDDRSSIRNYYSDREMSPAMSCEDGPKPIPDQEFTAQNSSVGHEYFLEENLKLKEELVDLGAGVLVDADQLLKCSRKNATKLTCDLSSLIFTREELATSSVTGKVPNMHKKSGITAKKRLNPAKVAAILAFVVREFGTTTTKVEILTAIKNKCNNTAKAVRREKERSFHMSV